jgi:hypothetical protein
MLRTSLFCFLLTSTSFAWSAPDPVIIPPETQSPGGPRAETVDVSECGQLVIFFEKLRADGQNTGSEIPLLAVLRDTMGDNDPAKDRLRQVGCLLIPRHRRPSESPRECRSSIIGRDSIAARPRICKRRDEALLSPDPSFVKLETAIYILKARC